MSAIIWALQRTSNGVEGQHHQSRWRVVMIAPQLGWKLVRAQHHSQSWSPSFEVDTEEELERTRPALRNQLKAVDLPPSPSDMLP